VKIIAVDSDVANNKLWPDALDIKDNSDEQPQAPMLWFKADSALLVNGKPFFIPNFTNECSAAVCLAVRVCRLGKCIAAKFAPRYYDAIAVAVDFTAEDVLRLLRQQQMPWDLAKSFDASVALGRWHELDALNNEAHEDVQLKMTVADKQTTIVVHNYRNLINNVIEKLSDIFTLRQGDILLVCKQQTKIVVQINDHVTGWLDAEKLTEFNVK